MYAKNEGMEEILPVATDDDRMDSSPRQDDIVPTTADTTPPCSDAATDEEPVHKITEDSDGERHGGCAA